MSNKTMTIGERSTNGTLKGQSGMQIRSCPVRKFDVEWESSHAAMLASIGAKDS